MPALSSDLLRMRRTEAGARDCLPFPLPAVAHPPGRDTMPSGARFVVPLLAVCSGVSRIAMQERALEMSEVAFDYIGMSYVNEARSPSLVRAFAAHFAGQSSACALLGLRARRPGYYMAWADLAVLARCGAARCRSVSTGDLL